MLDRTERRILGAIRLVDGVTGAMLTRKFDVGAPGLTLMRNRLGFYAIVAAEGLEEHPRSFHEPPALPPAGSLNFDVTVTDRNWVFTDTVQTISLPRALDIPADVLDLLEPIDIVLGSSAARSLPLGWAGLAVRLRDTAGTAIRGGLVEVLPDDGSERIGWGVSNDKGDVLVALSGLPLLREDEGDPLDETDDTIVTAETAMTVRAVVDPELPWPANPVFLAANAGSLRQAALPAPIGLRVGQSQRAILEVDLT